MFNLTGIPPAPRGVPQIEVTFDINADGILDATAKDKATNKEQKITITASTKLKEDEINKMVDEAEKHSEQDKKKKEEVETRNNADSLIYTTQKTLKDLGDKLSSDQKQKLEKEMKELQEALGGDDLEKIKSKIDSLTTTLQQAGTSVYQEAAKQQAPPKDEGEPGKKKEEEVVDAEYETVDEERKDEEKKDEEKK